MNVFQAMTTFMAVVETGSMTAAGERCGISPTMVGNYVRLLEERLGTSLLRRTTRRQSLTAFGAVYFEKCQSILKLLDETEHLAQAAQTLPSGTLRVTAPVTYGTQSVTPCLARYLAENPSVDVDLVLTERSVDLTHEKFDIAIRLGVPEPSSLMCRRLTDYRMTLCASPDYLDRREELLVPQQLATHDALAFAYTSSSPWHWARHEWHFESPKGRVTVEMRRRGLFNSTQAMRRAALGGLGIAMLPTDLVQDDLKAGTLQALLPDYTLPSRPIYLLYHKERYSAPTLHSFIRFIMRNLGDRPTGSGHGGSGQGGAGAGGAGAS
ncbi:LysR family transcriptional regulator [Gluconobacter sp. R71646]|uniref:LysR family transcriptional regulator n=2 Tax=Acetobacteraceae TaxID=433 RepID=A0ABR9YK10_9PROT|nr:LysR family transcriptional regulator [Gluconobacter sp. R71656]MBF0866307.1 LysR family transcriptional regulator [Gluconobacter sp. R75628]MBF0872565.1 LysR family transcriptional regulator [Gluconobacter sp. R75629]MBF0881531.1 LysR family transcriptional regulator [Gluconobacter potus]